MKARATIFLSGVSHEFGSFRDAVENEIQTKGCFAENQPSFAPDYNTVEEMLRRRLHDSDAVIHIVGFRFGAEPKQTPTDKPRRSYTQMEFDIARELQKQVYVFVSTDATVRDAVKSDEQPEDAEAVALQLAHRDAVQKTNYLYYFFKDKAELCKLAAEISPVAAAGFSANLSHFDVFKYAPDHLEGREDETKLLDDAWLKVRRAESPRQNILTFVALGGEGKTSLVAKWAADLAAQDWPGCDAAFAWSFHSQGTREQQAASSDLFLKAALDFFGDEQDKEFTASPAGAFEKGHRLARLVAERRSLLILDGLEPLQYAPGPPMRGKLKDDGVIALLRGLAANNHGLCIVTTRTAIPDLDVFKGETVLENELKRLPREAGVKLLKDGFKLKGRLLRNIPLKDGDPNSENVNEYEKLVEDVKGHALTLNLLGSYLHDAHGGDIRKRDLVKLAEADAEEQGGHAFRVMDAYGKSFESEGEKGRRALVLLRLLGLFDRPATADCLQALWSGEAIAGLTEPLVGFNEAQRNLTLQRLEDAKLLTVQRDEATGVLEALDAHPLLREYFAGRLREEQPEAWRAAHRRLYEHLCASTKEGYKPTLEDLQPLYQAVAHGCQAGLQQETCDKLYRDRISRGPEAYAIMKLGAFGSDLNAVACFFDPPWGRVSPRLSDRAQAWLLAQAAFSLRALGRLTEALEPMRATMEINARKREWKNAAVCASNLSELELTLGEVALAERDAAQSVTYADRSGEWDQKMKRLTTHADSLHQAGRRAEAGARFREAEQMQKENQPEYPLLCSLQGFQYCDLLLTEAERAAWQTILGKDGSPSRPRRDAEIAPYLDSCRAVARRAAQPLQYYERGIWASLLDIALDHLTLGRAAFYATILEGRAGSPLPAADDPARSDAERRAGSDAPYLETACRELDVAVTCLRRAGRQQYLPLGLLTRAWLHFLTGAQTGPESTQSDLDEPGKSRSAVP